MENLRIGFKNILSNHLKNKNKRHSIENIIYEKCLDDIDMYKNIFYETIYKIEEYDKEKNDYIIESIVSDITNNKFLLSEKSFDKYLQLQKEKDDFLDKPIDVDESVVSCNKCKSSKTYSYTKQVRSSDEGFTLFSFCFNCGNKWRTN